MESYSDYIISCCFITSFIFDTTLVSLDEWYENFICDEIVNSLPLEPHFVDRDVNYEDVNRKVLFVFNKEWHVNMTMLGYKRSVPVGDPTNQPE